MNALDPMLHPAVARIDSADRLIDADPRLLDVFASAGGGVGAPIAIPAVAALARLARRLGIAIARNAVIADGDDDLELVVRAEPDADGVTLIVSGWHARPAWRAARSAQDFVAAEADWIWESDAALRLTHVTMDAGARYGFDAAGVLGQPLSRLFALAEDDAGGFPILGAVAAQMRFDGQEAALRGTARRVRLSADPRLDARGHFAGFAGAVRMIDPPAIATPPPSAFPAGFGRRLDRSLRRPLERIIANASSMSAAVEGPLADSYTGYATDIATAGRHLLGLVDDLVDLEAVERADFVIAPEPLDLADVARRAAGLLAVRAAEGGVRIDRPGADEALPATGDFRRALQVLVNLIGNAVRYSPEGATLWVRAERKPAPAEAGGDTCCVIVADQGKGIAAADQAMIFEKFGRVHPGEVGGSGLGLYISRRLARAMGGDIVVDSAPGQGARFVFTLPAG